MTRLHVGSGTQRGALTVFPVWGEYDGPRGYDVDAAQAVLVEKQGGPSVSTLTATNQGSRPLLMLEGQLLEGGWQHRLLALSVLVAPGAVHDLDVVCVEQGRWGGGRRHGSNDRRASLRVRSGLNTGVERQGEVWDRVAELESRYGASPTSSFVDYVEQGADDVSQIVADLRPLPGQSGVLIAIAGQPVALEVFDSPRTLAAQFQSIIEAAGLDAVGRPTDVTPSRRARRFVDHVCRLVRDERGSAGLGTSLRSTSKYADLHALSCQDRDVHLVAVNPRHELVKVGGLKLTAAQLDRAVGVLVGAACGDALGAGYEFGSAPLPPAGEPPQMIGGGLGGFAPGDWTDDTAQTYVVAEVAARGLDLRTPKALDAIAAGLADWYASGPPDVGIQTGHVLSRAGRQPSAETLAGAARSCDEQTGRSGGNGSLMRTSAVALAHLGDAEALVEAARKVSALTHYDPRAGEACALWCLAISDAVLTGALVNLRTGLVHLSDHSRAFWQDCIDEAEEAEPTSFTPNGYVVTALQAAWSAIHHTRAGDRRFDCLHVQDGLEAAIRIGNDTDTVASIAGALLGARWGASAFPAQWRSIVHGYPGKRLEDLEHLAALTVREGRPDAQGWPGCARIDYPAYGGTTLVEHPHDPGVYLANASALDSLPSDVTAVVSLCRLGTEQVPAGLRHVTFRLLDTTDGDNPNLDFVLDEAARTVQALRRQGEVVVLHCVAAQSRTPTVAARYSAVLGREIPSALQEVVAVLPSAAPNAVLVAGLNRLATAGAGRPRWRGTGP